MASKDDKWDAPVEREAEARESCRDRIRDERRVGVPRAPLVRFDEGDASPEASPRVGEAEDDRFLPVSWGSEDDHPAASPPFMFSAVG